MLPRYLHNQTKHAVAEVPMDLNLEETAGKGDDESKTFNRHESILHKEMSINVQRSNVI